MAVYDRYTRFKGELRIDGGIRFGGGPATTGNTSPVGASGSGGQGLPNLYGYGIVPRRLTYVEDGTISVVVPAQAAASSADIAGITVANIKPGDTVILNPPSAAVESGLGFFGRCAVAGTLIVNISNCKGAAALTGSTSTWNYIILRGAA